VKSLLNFLDFGKDHTPELSKDLCLFKLLYCRPNHKPRKSILVELSFLYQNALKPQFYRLPKFRGEIPTTKQNRTT